MYHWEKWSCQATIWEKLQCNELNPGDSTFIFQPQDEFRTKESEFLQFPVRFHPRLWLIRNERAPIVLFWTPLMMSGPGWVLYPVNKRSLRISSPRLLLNLQWAPRELIRRFTVYQYFKLIFSTLYQNWNIGIVVVLIRAIKTVKVWLMQQLLEEAKPRNSVSTPYLVMFHRLDGKRIKPY